MTITADIEDNDIEPYDDKDRDFGLELDVPDEIKQEDIELDVPEISKQDEIDLSVDEIAKPVDVDLSFEQKQNDEQVDSTVFNTEMQQGQQISSPDSEGEKLLSEMRKQTEYLQKIAEKESLG